MIPWLKIHSSLPAFSRLIYGAWRLADGSNPSAQDTLTIIEICLEQGISTFDHADIYGNYRCETLFGEALKLKPSLRERMQLISKCDIMLMSDAYPERRLKHYDTSPAHIRGSVAHTLKRLGVEQIELLLLHRPDPLMDVGQTGACLDALVQEGRVAAVGVSNFKSWDLDLLQSAMRSTLVTNQIEISLLERSSFHDGTLAHSQRLGLPPMAWSPLAGGAVLGDGEAARRLRPALQRIAEQHGVAPDAVALAWLLAHPARIMPIVGTRHPQRLARLADAFKVSLDRETWFELWTLAAGQDVP